MNVDAYTQFIYHVPWVPVQSLKNFYFVSLSMNFHVFLMGSYLTLLMLLLLLHSIFSSVPGNFSKIEMTPDPKRQNHIDKTNLIYEWMYGHIGRWHAICIMYIDICVRLFDNNNMTCSNINQLRSAPNSHTHRNGVQCGIIIDKFILFR